MIKFYRKIRKKFISQVFFHEKWKDSWAKWLFISFNRLGVEFWHEHDSFSDVIIWLWPWKSRGVSPFLSLRLTNITLVDARFNSIEEINDFWKAFKQFEDNYTK